MAATRVPPVEHPGAVIKAELDTRGWSQRDLAFVLGKQEPQLNRILSGKGAISAEMALALADAFAIPAEFFANLQKQYELSHAKEPDPNVKRRATLQANYPLRDMIKRGWISDAETYLLELQVARFFEVGSIEEAPHIAHAAKKTGYDRISSQQLAWLFRVRQIARSIEIGPYSRDALQKALPKLRGMAVDPESVGQSVAVLSECGVRFVIVEQIANAKIDGVCFWLGDAPVIGMSLRLDRLDNFWFVLRHEIEHVLRGDAKEEAIIDDFESEAVLGVNEAERAANEAASDFCVPKAKMDSFLARKGNYVSERDIIGFAGVLNTHPALVVGQWHHRTGKYQLFRKYLVPIRKHIVGASEAERVLDGWGSVAQIDL